MERKWFKKKNLGTPGKKKEHGKKNLGKFNIFSFFSWVFKIIFDGVSKLIILPNTVLNVNTEDILGNELEVREGTYLINEFNKVTGYRST